VSLREQAVLFRTSSHSAQLELELSRRNIPFVKFGGLRFLEAATYSYPRGFVRAWGRGFRIFSPEALLGHSFKLRPELDGVTAPKLEPVCYRRARVRNESPYTLLPGKVQLFEGDDYLGATELKFAAPGQELELALGADERIRVERKLVGRDVDKTFLADRRRIRYKYRIEVENLRDTPQVVFVRDQLPVPRHEQVKVKLEAAEPRPARHTDLNQLEWKLTLEKNAKQVVQFEFSVEFPRTLDVVGLA